MLGLLARRFRELGTEYDDDDDNLLTEDDNVIPFFFIGGLVELPPTMGTDEGKDATLADDVTAGDKAGTPACCCDDMPLVFGCC